MIQVTCIRNPFDPLDSREIRKVRAGYQIRELVRGFNVHPGYDVAVSVDGRVLQSPEKMEYIPNSGSSVVFCAVPTGGDGKNPLAIVATLALMVVTAGAAAPLAGAIGIGGAMGTALVSSGMMIVGGLAISAIFPMTQPDTGGGAGAIDVSPTYAWERGSNVITEGFPLPELFGTCRVTPPLVGQYVYAENDKQYLNMLFAVAGHQLYSLLDIRINDTPIENMIGISYEPTRDYRDGSVTQPVLQHFDDTRTDVPVGVKLTDPLTYTTRTTTGTLVHGFSFTFSFPKGIYYMNDNGGMESYTIKFYAEFKKTTESTWNRLTSYNSATETVNVQRWSAGYWYSPADGVPDVWYEVYTDAGPHTESEQYFSDEWIMDPETGQQQQKIYMWREVLDEIIYVKGTRLLDHISITRSQVAPVYFTVPAYFPYPMDPELPGGYQFDFRCKLWGSVDVSARHGSDVYWDSFQEIVLDDFTYPGVALVALRALATDQLSGAMPRVDMLATRNYVPVWTGAQYEQKQAWIPAWACYHILHRAEYVGTGDLSAASSYEVRGIPASRIDYAAFMSWAGWCWEN